MSTERLDRLISRLGYCTRSELKRYLGEVTVDGERPRRSDVKVTASQVRWQGEPMDPDPLWILLHKPEGVTCSHKDVGRLVFEMFPERYLNRRPGLSTVGRLDKDTTGILLLTTDGAALHRLTSPRHQVDKVYVVDLENEPDDQDLAKIEKGGWLLEEDDKPLLPCSIRRLNSKRVEMILHEGRYHQVKRMWTALGNNVEKLHRSRFAHLGVEDLEPGQFRLLEPEEVVKF